MPSLPKSASTGFGAWLALLGVGLSLSLAACDPPGKPKLSTEKLPEDVTDFHTLYEQNCAGCHGTGGKNGPGRILNDPLYLAVLPRETLKQILVYGRPGTAMPAWSRSQGGPLTPQQIDSLVNGIESWAKPFDANGAPLPAYSASTEGDPDQGRKLFARNCFMCHGPGAKVGLVTDPNYLSLVSDQMIRTSIIVGRSDLGMPSYKNLKLGKALDDQDITNLTAFLSSKRPAEVTEAMNAAASKLQSGGTGDVSGQQVGQTGAHTNESGAGEGGFTGRGNEGSGNGPGSPHQERREGNKGTGASSQQGVK